MTIVNSVVPFVIIIIVLIIVHELGHFVTAKLAGVRVLEFGLGYPPRLWAKQFGDTEYSLNALPIGGFVRLMGEEDPSDPRSLAAKPRPVRLIVLGAGSAMNFLFAIVLFAAGFMLPREVSVGRAVVDEVMPNSPAAEAGFEQGDVIWKINDREVQNVLEASRAIRLNLGETLTMGVKRQGEFVDLSVRARWAPPDIVHVVEPGEDVHSVAERLGLSVETVRATADIKSTVDPDQELTIVDGSDVVTYTPDVAESVTAVAQRLGVSIQSVRTAAGLPDPDKLDVGQELRLVQGPTGIMIRPQYSFTETQSYSPLKALRLGTRNTFDSLTLFRNELIFWIKGGGSPEISGPIGIAQATGEVVEEAGWKTVMDLAAILSVNLAIINILPLPMLDGGRIIFVLLEVARGGRRVAPQKEALVHLVGLAALLTLAVVVSYFDIVRIIQGDSIFR